MFVLFKWLLWLCMPYSLVLIGLLTLIVWLFWRKVFLPAVCLLVLWFGLLVMSMPAVSTAMGAALEAKFPPKTLAQIPKADAVVVLGGGIGRIRPGLPYPECYPASDRAVMAARLYHAGKAPLIVPSGTGALQAEKPLLEAMKVPSKAIFCDSVSRDTAENAQKTVEILRVRKCRTVLLVTSSWHLPRAIMLFKAEGIRFIPVGCDYEATLAKTEAPVAPLWMKLPSPAAAAQFGVYLKEYLGILFYSLHTPSAEPAPKAAAQKTTPPKKTSKPAAKPVAKPTTQSAAKKA